ncbi:ATP-binding protein [Sorangium sp. So ce185]|uniref:ATP-binding response regulator n=1 Tax=Sorangium sp. So ce185 TaxID=3133287 RepID=UPI003F61603C
MGDGGAADCSERVLVLAPVGRDTPLLCQVLGRAGIEAARCGRADELATGLLDGAGAALLTEEALSPMAVSALLAALTAQPSWSDLPVLLLAGAEPLALRSAQAVAALRSAGNVTVLERPVRELTLVTAVQAALRARRRQLEVRDLVERERAARQAAETARQQVEDASRVKDEFLANVSHELRTPLNAILLWTRQLTSNPASAQDVARGLLAIERSARAQSRLVEDLLDLARMASGKLRLSLQDVDLAQVAEAAVEVVRPAAEARRIQLDAALAAGLGRARVDPERMQQVLWNLLSNAVKFTPPGGRVRLSARRDGGEVRIEVADTGRGIRPELLPHVFERFRQHDAATQRRQGGLGLGLAICRQLVELHGGTLSADSRGEGLGAVFTVALPLADAVPRDAGSRAAWPAAAAPRRPAAAAPRRPAAAVPRRPAAAAPREGAAAPAEVGAAASARPLAGIRVLLVEDDSDTREVLVCTLEAQGAEVTAVGSPQAALEALEPAASPAERPQVLLSDLGMPGMDGYELLRRLRALEGERGDRPLPAALLTAYARHDDRARALSAGFAAYLAKPIEPERLIAVIEQLARQRG